MIQHNLFAITKANFFLKLEMQDLPAKVTTEQPAFPIHYNNGDAPEWKGQKTCKIGNQTSLCVCSIQLLPELLSIAATGYMSTKCFKMNFSY